MTSLPMTMWLKPAIAQNTLQTHIAAKKAKGRWALEMLLSGMITTMLVAASVLTTEGPTSEERMFLWCGIGGTLGALATYCAAGKESGKSLGLHCLGNLVVAIALGPPCSFYVRYKIESVFGPFPMSMYLVVAVTFFLGLIGLCVVKLAVPMSKEILAFGVNAITAWSKREITDKIGKPSDPAD